jgi:hypothetical protein
LSARPLPVRPPGEPRRRGRRRRHLIAIVAAAAVVGVGSGVGIALLRPDRPPAAKPGAAVAPPGLVQYYLQASVVDADANSATISWGRQAESAPGFAGYIVYDVTDGQHAIRTPTALGRGRTSYTAPLFAGRRTCYRVAALVAKAPPEPQAQPTCVSLRASAPIVPSNEPAFPGGDGDGAGDGGDGGDVEATTSQITRTA